MSEEQFAQYNIDRNNKKRVDNEHDKQQLRKNALIKNNRVDTEKPMYNSNSANHSRGGNSGGGSISYGMIMFFGALLLIRRKTLRLS